MINIEQQLKLQAYLDGELSGAEARQVAEWVARDNDASALLAELRQTNHLISEFEADLKLPESREFYWSKIKGAIEREERLAARADANPGVPWFARLRRLLVPVAGMALVTFFAVLGIRNSAGPHRPGTLTFLEDAQAFTYHDYSAGATLVWLSYPADKKIAGEDELTILE